MKTLPTVTMVVRVEAVEMDEMWSFVSVQATTTMAVARDRSSYWKGIGLCPGTS
ncbi:MAG: hypothetical protein ACFBSG_13850 [Leptolyngbyaceae cyanobacterium]